MVTVNIAAVHGEAGSRTHHREATVLTKRSLWSVPAHLVQKQQLVPNPTAVVRCEVSGSIILFICILFVFFFFQDFKLSINLWSYTSSNVKLDILTSNTGCGEAGIDHVNVTDKLNTINVQGHVELCDH